VSFQYEKPKYKAKGNSYARPGTGKEKKREKGEKREGRKEGISRETLKLTYCTNKFE
jgi:hypothetical protein